MKNMKRDAESYACHEEASPEDMNRERGRHTNPDPEEEERQYLVPSRHARSLSIAADVAAEQAVAQ